jgi:ligand-binding sensor domain-containing protein
MKLDHKSLALLVLVVGALVVGAYMMGQQRATIGSGAEPVAAMPAPARTGDADARLPSDHPPLAGGGRTLSGAAQSLMRGGNLPFTHFRVGNRNVKGLMVDGKTAWIGTSGGMIRYDTVTEDHEIFDNRVDGILSNGIFHVSKLDDRIVAGTYGGGMSLYDPATGKWKNYNIPDGLADQFVYGVIKAGDGDVWIATWSGVNRVRGGDLDNRSKWETFTVENTNGGLPNPWVYGLSEGLNGDMWFATEEGLALYRDGEWTNWRHKDGLGAPFDVVKDAIQFSNDPAAYSDHHAQQQADLGMEEHRVAYNPNYVISLAVDSQGIVWAGTWGGGLARFDGREWRNFTTADGLPGNHIFMLYLDGEERLWIGTSHGLARLNRDGRGFSVMTTTDGLFADNVFSMSLAEDGTLWAGSFGGVARIASVH